jgi:alpha-beta hydrolase superfamily lysophospholipase
MMDPEVGARVSGVVLTSPAVGIQPSHPLVVVRISVILDFLVHKLQKDIGWYFVDVRTEIKSLNVMPFLFSS